MSLDFEANTYHQIDVIDLYLDPENPRHDPLDDEAEIIETLVKEEKVKRLAKDIASLNSISPLDIIGVIPLKDEDQTHYVAVEGNRRTCALKLLNNPSLAPAGEQAYFAKLAKENQIPSTVMCYVFSDREIARPWRDRRHNGQQDGIGTREWDAIQKARAQENSRDALSYSVIQYAKDKGLWTPVDGNDKGVITTLSRYFGIADFRSWFGISTGIREKNVQITAKRAGFDSRLKRFLDDVSNPSSRTGSRQNKNEILDYGKTLLLEPAPLEVSSTPYSLSDTEKDGGEQNKNGSKNTNGGNKGGRQKRHPDDRKNVIPKAFKPTISDTNLLKVLKEAQSIDSHKHPLASLMLLRSFLDFVYRKYCHDIIGKTVPPLDTNKGLNWVAQHLKKKTDLTLEETKACKALMKVGSDEHNALSPATLGFYTHNGAYPDHRLNNRGWDNISAIIDRCLRELEEATIEKARKRKAN